MKKYCVSVFCVLFAALISCKQDTTAASVELPKYTLVYKDSISSGSIIKIQLQKPIERPQLLALSQKIFDELNSKRGQIIYQLTNVQFVPWAKATLHEKLSVEIIGLTSKQYKFLQTTKIDIPTDKVMAAWIVNRGAKLAWKGVAYREGTDVVIRRLLLDGSTGMWWLKPKNRGESMMLTNEVLERSHEHLVFVEGYLEVRTNDGFVVHVAEPLDYEQHIERVTPESE